MEFAFKKTYEYLKKFGKCPGCRKALEVSYDSHPWDSEIDIIVRCPSCGSFPITPFGCTGLTQNKIIKNIYKEMYRTYQEKLAERLMED